MSDFGTRLSKADERESTRNAYSRRIPLFFPWDLLGTAYSIYITLLRSVRVRMELPIGMIRQLLEFPVLGL